MAFTFKVSGTLDVYTTGDITDKETTRRLSWTEDAFLGSNRFTFDLAAAGTFVVPLGNITTVHAIYVFANREVVVQLTPTTDFQGVAQADQHIPARFLVIGDNDSEDIAGADGYTAITIEALFNGTEGEIVFVGGITKKVFPLREGDRDA